MSGPLKGLRVLDLTTVVMGPLATQILGDLGAEVIKVERPGGDSNRYLSPGRNQGMSGMAMTMHRNKRSIELNLKEPISQTVLLDLVERTDVLVHNMLPNVIESLGLQYEHLSERNPKLIYCTATGFADGGDYSGCPAYDDLIQGASGIASLMAGAENEPAYFPGVICDKVTGLTVVYAILAACLYREKTGLGQQITVPMFETMLSFNLAEHASDHIFSPSEGEFGYRRVLSKNRKPYKTLDGYICVIPYTDRNWRDFFTLVGRPELVEDNRFSDIAQRTKHIDELYKIVSFSLGNKTSREWMEIFETARIPAMPVLDLANIENDPHIKSTGFISHRTHATQGDFKSIGVPIDFSISSPDDPKDAPTIGRDSEDILSELGYSDEQIQEICRT